MIDRCQLHGEELEGEWEDNPPATRVVTNFSRSLHVPARTDWFTSRSADELWLCEDCYKMIRQHDLHLVPMEVPLWS